MNYLINRAKMTLSVHKIMKVNEGYRIIGGLVGKPHTTIIAFIHDKKIKKDLDIQRMKSYDFEGYLTEAEYFFKQKTYTVQLIVDEYTETNTKDKPFDRIELVGKFIEKSTVKTLKNKKTVCNIKLELISENLKNTRFEIAVWNKAIDVLNYVRVGQKIHLTAFAFGNFNDGNKMYIKISPFKITLL